MRRESEFQLPVGPRGTPRGTTPCPICIALAGLLMVAGCGPRRTPVPSASLHYLGHASFVLTFEDTLTVLTDYGESNAYGLDSPVHSLATLVPDIITRSHEHSDHAGGTLPEGPIRHMISGMESLSAASVDQGQRFQMGNLRISTIPTHEGPLKTPPDNTSFLFDFRGLKILHLGDCQGLMLALGGGAEEEGTQVRDEAVGAIRSLYPDHYDLVLLPIGFVHDILTEAAEFVTHLDTDAVVPMHFWSPGDRDRFLTLMEGRHDRRGRSYRSRNFPGAELALPTGPRPEDTVLVIGLSPGPWTRPGSI